jgi:CRP-like cAMP-binding protein
VSALFRPGGADEAPIAEATSPQLGRVYRAGELIFRQGDFGDCMYVIQDGQVEILHERDGHEVCFANLKDGDTFGETAMFEDFNRSSTARTITNVRAITVDRKTLMRKFHEDPSMVYRIMQVMARRITLLAMEVVRLNIDRLESARGLIDPARSGRTPRN